MKCIILLLVLVYCATGTEIAGDITNTTRILLTGGSLTDTGSSSVFPSSLGCFPPSSLPSPRNSHVTFTTDSGLVATRGGMDESYTPLSTCLVLEAGGKWRQDPRVPHLPQTRVGASSVTVAAAGVFLMGGVGTETSSWRSQCPLHPSGQAWPLDLGLPGWRAAG